MSGQVDKDLEDASFKQMMNLPYNRDLVKKRLSISLFEKGYTYESDLVLKLNRTEEETKHLVEIINKVFPCSKS